MFLLQALRILKDALFAPRLTLHTRALLLCLQPITFLTYTIQWAVSRKFPHSAEIPIPLRRAGETVRAVVYLPPSYSLPSQSQERRNKLPLHLNLHGGAFLGGLPEGNARFCHALAASGVVVVSSAYRYAPVHTFPDAHEDALDVAVYLVNNAERLWGADPETLTVSGFSVGGNLALGVAQLLSRQTQSEPNLEGRGIQVCGLVSFEGVVDFRLPPWCKPKPDGFPKYDPLSFLMHLFDTYAGPNRARDYHNSLLHPTLADIRTLPRNMFFVVGGNDILLDETEGFTGRLEGEARMINRVNGVEVHEEDGKVEPDGKTAVVRRFVAEGQIHGWTEMPSLAINVELRTKAFNEAIDFLRAVHRVYGSSE
ncbi:putative lipase/esterase family protein, partial [Aspergillus undulatus]|uniref:putative lipase/esterase family protein n=1 Tax=Aspergillus undulatus TaxID=1810928 RepID=UPI003CCD260B